MTPDEKGSIAEAMIAAAAVKLRVPVLKPINDGTRYDLVLDLGDRFMRVQCKWARKVGGALVISTRSCRRGREGFIRRPYTADEIDAIAAYSADLERIFLVPIEIVSGGPAISLRVEATRNNQQAGIRWAGEFDFAATLGRLVGP